MFHVNKMVKILFFVINTIYCQTWIMNGIFQARSGVIESPHPYGNAQHALWKIVAPRGGKLWFRFHELEIEVDRMNGRCINDALTIYEEDDEPNRKSIFATPPICGYLRNSSYAEVTNQSDQ